MFPPLLSFFSREVLLIFFPSICRTCLTNELMQTPLSALPKIEDRTVKIFLAGSTYGTGKMLRQRLACSEIYKDTSSVRLEK